MQYPVGTPEISSVVSENMTNGGQGVETTGAQIGNKRNAFIGSCKHHIWQSIRASSAAPYYLDDYSDGTYFFSAHFVISFLAFYLVIDESHRNFSLSLFSNLNVIGVYRWQDGAIVANNPTIFAIREAQLLWPDSKIDCLVSVGCGSVPTKVPWDFHYGRK